MLSRVIIAARKHLDARPDVKLVAINSTWLVGDKVLRLVIGLLVGAWVARYLGPANYGKLAYVIAFMAIFQAFSVLGLDGIIVRDLAQKTVLPRQTLGTALVLRLTASSLALSAACLSIYILYPADTEYVCLVLLVGLSLLFQTADIADLWFQSQSQSRRTVSAKAIAYVLAALVKIGLILGSAPLWAFAAVQGGETIISAGALYLSYKRYPSEGTWVWSGAVAKKMLRQSWPFLLSALLIIVYMRSSQFFINKFVGTNSVGIYSAAIVLSELWYFLPMTIATSVAPIVARRKAQGALAYEHALEQVFGVMWLLSISISICVALIAEPIVAALYGEAYRGAAKVLSIHIFTLVPVCLGVSQSIWLINENKSSLAIYQALLGAVTSVSLNFILIRNYGVVGAALATVVSQFVQAFGLTILLSPKLVQMQMRALIMPISFVCGAVFRSR